MSTTINSVFQDTAFGRILRLVSGGRVFGWEEYHDNAILERYLNSARDNDSAATDRELDNEEVEKGQDYQLITWTENDPQNPRNWSSAKKGFVTAQICLLTTSVYIGSAIYTAGIPSIVQDFHVSPVAALLGLTLFVLGYGIGPMLWSPMSEMPFIGRNPIYIGTLLIFVALQPAVIFAKNFGMLLAFRFITAFFGSPALATGGASIADMYSPEKVAYGISVWGAAAALGPVLGPIIGGFAAENEGWTWTIWELMWLSGFCLLVLFFFFPETSSANILYRRTVRLRKIVKAGEEKEKEKSTENIATVTPPPALNLKCEPEIIAEGFTGRAIAMMILVLPFTLSFTEPIVFFLNLYIALVYALLYLWFESFPIVFGGIYHFNSGIQGLAFVGILVGVLVAMPCFWWYLYTVYEPKYRQAGGKLPPEERLKPAQFGAFFIPVCLFIFAWGSRESVHWIVPIIGTAFFSPGVFLLFMAVLGYLGDAYPDHIASVYAGNDLMRASFGASFPLFADAMFARLGIDWGCTMLALLSICFVPIPFVLVRFGKGLRMRSRHARHDL